VYQCVIKYAYNFGHSLVSVAHEAVLDPASQHISCT